MTTAMATPASYRSPSHVRRSRVSRCPFHDFHYRYHHYHHHHRPPCDKTILRLSTRPLTRPNLHLDAHASVVCNSTIVFINFFTMTQSVSETSRQRAGNALTGSSHERPHPTASSALSTPFSIRISLLNFPPSRPWLAQLPASPTLLKTALNLTTAR